MIDPAFVFVAIALRIFAGANYFTATVKGDVQPNPVTWFFWGLAPFIAFAAQVQNGLAPASWVTLALGIGPLLIFGVTLTKNRNQRWRLGVFDILCGVAAAIGLVLWQVTSDPLLALTFGIVADILGGLPTVHKAYVRPQSEKALPYVLSLSSMVITLLTLDNWGYIHAGFPIYIFCINSVIALLVWSQVGPRIRAARNKKIKTAVAHQGTSSRPADVGE